MLPEEGVEVFKTKIFSYILKNYHQILKDITQEESLTRGIRAQLDQAFLEFLKAEKIV